MVTYGTSAIPSDIIEVLSGGTVAISAAFENTMVVVGGMDTAEGNATPGELVRVSSPSDAQTKFGDGSELHQQSSLAFQNGVGELRMLPVEESTETESFTGSASGTLSNVPFFDPAVQPEHEITAQDTVESASVDVNVVYTDGSPSAPSEANTINLDYVTGQWTADESSDYEITYDYGDYSSGSLQAAVDSSPRMLAVCTESESVVNDVATEVNDNATDFDFMHSLGGAKPRSEDDTATAYATNYTDGVDERRVSLAFSPRGYVDDAETTEVRTVGAIGGYLASLSLGLSSTNDSIGGLTGLRTELTPSEAGTLIDSQVMPLIDYPPVTIVKDMTTSTDPRFERVYGMQVVDEATEISHVISREFVGEQNTTSNRNLLKRSHRNAYRGMEDSSPPLLDDYTVSVTENESDPNQVDVEIGLDIVDIMDTVSVTITVGDIIRNEGAE